MPVCLVSVACLFGALLATASTDSAPARSNVRIITTQRGHAAFSPDGRMLLVGPADGSGSVEVWDVPSGEKVAALAKSAGVIRSVAWSADGHLAAAAGANQQVTVWDALTWKTTHVLKGHTAIVHAIAFSPNGKRLASGSSDKTVWIWNLSDGAVIHTLTQPDGTELSEHSVGIPGMVFAVAYSPDGAMLASGGGDGLGHAGELVLWNSESGKPLRRISAEDGRQVWAIAWGADGRALASGTTAGTITVYDVPTGEVRREFRGTAELRSLAISHDGRTLAAGLGHNIELWDIATGELTQTIQGEGKFISSLDFSSDGKLLAFGDQGGIKLWKLAE